MRAVVTESSTSIGTIWSPIVIAVRSAGLSVRDQERFRELIFRCVTQLTAGKEELAS